MVLGENPRAQIFKIFPHQFFRVDSLPFLEAKKATLDFWEFFCPKGGFFLCGAFGKKNFKPKNFFSQKKTVSYFKISLNGFFGPSGISRTTPPFPPIRFAFLKKKETGLWGKANPTTGGDFLKKFFLKTRPRLFSIPPKGAFLGHFLTYFFRGLRFAFFPRESPPKKIFPFWFSKKNQKRKTPKNKFQT